MTIDVSAGQHGRRAVIQRRQSRHVWRAAVLALGALTLFAAGSHAEADEFLQGFSVDNRKLAEALAAPERISEGEACAVKAILAFSGRRLDHSVAHAEAGGAATARRMRELRQELLRLREAAAQSASLQQVLARCPVQFDTSD